MFRVSKKCNKQQVDLTPPWGKITFILKGVVQFIRRKLDDAAVY